MIFSNLPEDFETLGLMQCAAELYVDEGATVSYNFLHLTVQDYPAAFHTSQQPVKKQIEKYKAELKRQWYMQFYGKCHHHHFHMVLRFLCGINKFKGYSNEILSTFCTERYHGNGSHSVCR